MREKDNARAGKTLSVASSMFSALGLLKATLALRAAEGSLEVNSRPLLKWVVAGRPFANCLRQVCKIQSYEVP